MAVISIWIWEAGAEHGLGEKKWAVIIRVKSTSEQSPGKDQIEGKILVINTMMTSKIYNVTNPHNAFWSILKLIRHNT